MSLRCSLLGGVLAVLCALSSVHAITITANNSWEHCQLHDTITNAGDYYSSSIESATLTCSDSHISISGITDPLTEWTVSSRLNTVLSGMNLDLVRVDGGDGGGVVTEGDSYITQTTAPRIFFHGTGNVSQIKIRFRIGDFDASDGNGAKNIQLNYDISTTN